MADLRTVLRIIAKDETKGRLTKTQAELKGIGTTLGDLRNQAIALAGINFGIGGLAQLVALADGYALTTSRLKLLSGETTNFSAVQKEVFEIAQSTFTTYEQTASIYGNLAASTKEVGVSSKELLAVTKALNQSYLISGSTQQEAKASTLQLVQALASGQIRGQEFNSVAEQGRRILFALKDATGLTAGELREFANQGKLTTEFFLKSFLPQAQKINEEFDTLPLTVGRALTQLQNEFERFVGEQNKELGITRDIALAFQDLAANFEDFAKVVVTSGGVIVAYLSQQFIAALGRTTAQKFADIKASIATVKANQALALSTQAAAKAELQAAAATEARLAAQLASERATLAAAKALGVAGGQRVALERTINQLNIEHVAAVNARIAADARLVAINGAVTASTVRATIATRAWNSALLFLGGPVGAGFTALAALAGAVYYFNTQVESGTDKYNDFTESLHMGKHAADEQATSIDHLASALEKVKFSQQRAEIAAGEAAVRALREEIAALELEIEQGGGNLIDPLSGVAAPGDIELLDSYKAKSEDAQKKVDELKAKLIALIKRDRELADELGRDGKSLGGIPQRLSDAIEKQKEANTELGNIEARRRKLVDSLAQLSAELSGPKIDVKEQSDAFNIAALNTIRGQIQGDIEEGEAERAISNLEKAKTIIEQLQKTGGASDSYLKTQVDLIDTLAKEAGDIDVTPEVNEDALVDKLQKEKSIRQQFLEQNPDVVLAKTDTDQAIKEAKAANDAMQAYLNQNPLRQGIITSGDRTLGLGDLPANAAGGYIRGPGSGTSDSILSWLSNGEYVLKAAAVRHYGADFIDRLNRMTLPRFAGGGPVRASGVSPPAATGAPIVFNLNGQSIKAVVSGGGVDDLRSALRRENMRRGIRA